LLPVDQQLKLTIWSNSRYERLTKRSRLFFAHRGGKTITAHGPENTAEIGDPRRK
jgi:hypothetical protein